MSTATINLTTLDDAVLKMYRDALGHFLKIELLETPDGVKLDDEGRLLDPYTIIYPMTVSVLWGTWGSPQANSRVPYQLTNVGRNREQAQRMADRNREIMLMRNPNGDFHHPIIASDAQVIDRYCITQGRPEPSGGGLWQVVDRFNLEVSSV